VRAVTIRQPGAAAVFARPGPFQLPAWRTDHRGPLLIHAGKRGRGDPPDGPGSRTAYAALLGVVDLVDCVTVGAADETGYVWVLANPRRFAHPVPHAERGVGLFDVPAVLVAGVLERAARRRTPAPKKPRRKKV